MKTLFERATEILNERQEGENVKMGADTEALADAVEEMIWMLNAGIRDGAVTRKSYPEYTADNLRESRRDNKSGE